MSEVLKCSPVEMKKSLVMVDTFRDAGIEFMPIPVSKRLTKEMLMQMMISQLDDLEKYSVVSDEAK